MRKPPASLRRFCVHKKVHRDARWTFRYFPNHQAKNFRGKKIGKHLTMLADFLRNNYGIDTI